MILKLLENAVYLALPRNGKKVMYYKGKQEVDFIILSDYIPEEVVQVCATDLHDKQTFNREVAGLLECLNPTELDRGVIVTWNGEGHIRKAARFIELVPAYKWFLKGMG